MPWSYKYDPQPMHFIHLCMNPGVNGSRVHRVSRPILTMILWNSWSVTHICVEWNSMPGATHIVLILRSALHPLDHHTLPKSILNGSWIMETNDTLTREVRSHRALL